MFAFTIAVNGVSFPSHIKLSEFGTVDLAKAVPVGRYARKGKTGSVICDGQNMALNPDIVTRRGSKIISAEPNKLPDSGLWGLVDGAWDIVPEKKEEPKAEQPKEQAKEEPKETADTPVAPEDTF